MVGCDGDGNMHVLFVTHLDKWEWALPLKNPPLKNPKVSFGMTYNSLWRQGKRFCKSCGNILVRPSSCKEWILNQIQNSCLQESPSHYLDNLRRSWWSEMRAFDGWYGAYEHFHPFRNQQRSGTASCGSNLNIIPNFRWVRIGDSSTSTFFFHTKSTFAPVQDILRTNNSILRTKQWDNHFHYIHCDYNLFCIFRTFQTLGITFRIF